MNRHELSKLQTLLARRLDRMMGDLFPGKTPATFLSSKGISRLREEWAGLCSEIGITPLQDGTHDFEPPGEIFEESVTVYDPVPGGAWLEMSRDTALKILTLGIP